MEVRKSDGSYQNYSKKKLITVIKRAYKSAGLEYSEEVAEGIVSSLYVYDGILCSDIRTQVEDRLKEIDLSLYSAYKGVKDKKDAISILVDEKKKFIAKYEESFNTADATIDDNSNLSNKNISILNAELHKEENQQINYKLIEDKVRELFPDFDYKQLKEDIDSVCYWHDFSSQVGMPYCVAISMYPFLLNGIKDLGGLSARPKNIDSFCGMFVNLIFAVAAQFKGAVAAPGVWLCMDWFLRKEYGEDYHLNKDVVVSGEICTRKITVEQQIHQYFQQICYSLMQPSGSRGCQAVFWNCSIFDKPFFDTMYGDFKFPDGTSPVWDSFNWLQKNFLHWLNQERLKCVLTFPVVSACLIYQEGKFLDEGLYDFVCQEYSEGNSFFTYISDSADSLSSCCRLSSKLQKPQFNFTNGQLSEMTGSKNVITLNFNRIVQDWVRTFNVAATRGDVAFSNLSEEQKDDLKKYIINILERVYKYQESYNEILKDLFSAGLLTVYKAGFIDLKKQYLTIGINALNQAAEFLGMECNKNKDYEEFCSFIFSTIKDQNTLHKTKDMMFNTEFTPCESAAIKLYDRDKRDGYWVPEDTNLYASYIFKPNDPNISVLDKIYLHGASFCGDNLDGGSAAHINLDAHLTKKQYKKLLTYAAETGCKYFGFNTPMAECEDCGYISRTPFDSCPRCGSKNISLWDRVIGYLTKIKNWSKGRRIEQKTRVYAKSEQLKGIYSSDD